MTDESNLDRLVVAIERQRTAPRGPTGDSASIPRRERLRQRELALAGYHQARLLILLTVISGPRGKVIGLTKIAKLDFLLRYPEFLEELLKRIGENELASQVQPTPAERNAVETRMIRYKYGPWDDRYYSILGALLGRGLIEYTSSNDVLTVRPTAGGKALHSSLVTDPAWAEVERRAGLIKSAFGRMSGNRIKELIFEHLPGVVDRPLRTEI